MCIICVQILSQVGKAHFELVDYLEANRTFSNARLVSPYSLEGMDVYSTVLYVSFLCPTKVISYSIIELKFYSAYLCLVNCQFVII